MFTIASEILNLTYVIATILERINVIRERTRTPQIRSSTHHNDSSIFAQFMLTVLRDIAIEFRDKYLNDEIRSENGTANSLLLQLISHNPGITLGE